LSLIRADVDAQPRDHINKDKIGEYAEAMVLGDPFPPLVVFSDGETYWLADGFHRLHAALGCEFESYECEVHEGGKRDAILYSVGANATHGYARGNDDKRRSVRRLLRDPEWVQWSDREIARRCRVHHEMVGKQRAEMFPVLTGGSASDERVYTTKHGTEATMATGGINANRPPSQDQLEQPDQSEQPERSDQEYSPVVDLPFKSQDDVDRDIVNDFRSDFASHSYIATSLWDMEKSFKGLPLPVLAAEQFPQALLHSFSPDRARAIRDWLDTFATAFEQRKDVQNVAAE